MLTELYASFQEDADQPAELAETNLAHSELKRLQNGTLLGGDTRTIVTEGKIC